MERLVKRYTVLWIAGFVVLSALLIFLTPISTLLRAPGPWPTPAPMDCTAVILHDYRSAASLSGEKAAEFARLLEEDTIQPTKLFPELSPSYITIELYSDGTLLQTLYYSSRDHLISNSAEPLQLQYNARICGEALEELISYSFRQVNLYHPQDLRRLPMLTPKEINSPKLTCDGEPVSIDAAQLENLPALLEQIKIDYNFAEKSAQPDARKTKPAMHLSFRWGTQLKVDLLQRSFENNTFLTITYLHQSPTVIYLPAGYDLFAELGMELPATDALK